MTQEAMNKLAALKAVELTPENLAEHKHALEAVGREVGIELDKRHDVPELVQTLDDHIALSTEWMNESAEMAAGTGVSQEASVETTVAGVPIEAHASTEAEVHASAGINDGVASAEVGASVGAEAGASVGNDTAGASVGVSVEATAGVEAHAGFDGEDVTAGGSAGAMVEAHATAEGHVDVLYQAMQLVVLA